MEQCESNRDHINQEQRECGGAVSGAPPALFQSLVMDNSNDDFVETGSYSGEGNPDDSLSFLNDPLLLSHQTLDSTSVPMFVIPATDRYVRMEIDMYHKHNELLGGFRSACWRSRHRNNLFGPGNIVDTSDAKFMFYVTSLNRQHTESMNDTLYKLLAAIEQRHDISYMQDGVTVPTCKSDANKYVLKGEYTIMDLLLRPKLHIISKHA